MTEHERQITGTANCPDVVNKRLCSYERCGQVWVDGETPPPGCIAFCSGPDGKDRHEMFDRNTEEVVNECVDLRLGGKHLGQREYEKAHPSAVSHSRKIDPYEGSCDSERDRLVSVRLEEVSSYFVHCVCIIFWNAKLPLPSVLSQSIHAEMILHTGLC